MALLCAALPQGDNVDRFLDALDIGLPIDPHEVAVYVEYAFLRDIWAGIGPDNVLKRRTMMRRPARRGRRSGLHRLDRRLLGRRAG